MFETPLRNFIYSESAFSFTSSCHNFFHLIFNLIDPVGQIFIFNVVCVVQVCACTHPISFYHIGIFLLFFFVPYFFHLFFLRFFLMHARKADFFFPEHFLAARFILAQTARCLAVAITSPSMYNKPVSI